MIARLEHLDKGDNPRYIVTNLEAARAWVLEQNEENDGSAQD